MNDVICFLLLTLFAGCAIPQTILVKKNNGSEKIMIQYDITDKSKCSYIGDAIGVAFSIDNERGEENSLNDLVNIALSMEGDTLDLVMRTNEFPNNGLVGLWKQFTFSHRMKYVKYARVLQCNKITKKNDEVQLTDMEPLQKQCRYLGDQYFSVSTSDPDPELWLRNMVQEIKIKTKEKGGNLFVVNSNTKVVRRHGWNWSKSFFLHGRFYSCESNGITNLL